MKKLHVFAALSLTIALTGATSNAFASNHEAVCLAMSRVGQAAAESRDLGMTEDALVKSLTVGASKNVLTRVVQYVYTMQLAPADARKMVYLKCLAGDFPR